ncbi:hypothetical protein PRZ48_009946 [Zasmidium cellare]|uniref:SGNH hydrolase-type esterase domain-containing protein n=1 Tax=Zasmidium cellare TaxID=395010 RepID=A0ABR0ED90_ZASCE|nr:hypothetical protein PRZ48_009946 [Zasmidium cellare]
MFFSVSLKFSLLAILTTFIPATQAHPFTGEAASWESLSADVFNTSNIEPRQNRKPEWLRIMPLGASITRGVGSSPEDGYRKPLRDRLRSLGYKVNMVGSQSNPQGSMTNGAHEGHSGHLIRQAYDNMDNSIGKKPNLVLINVGTNDCNQNVDINGAVQRLTDVVDKVFRESQRATVILSTLLINRGNSDANGRVSFVNQGIRRMVYEKRQDGQRIVLADMNDGKFITAGDLSDDLHPTNDGYRKMAAVWDAAIGKAVEEGKVQDPEDTGIPDEGPGNDCKKVAGDGKGPVKMQQGSGEDDGQYRHKSTGMGVIWSSDDRAPLALVIGFEFAQIVNALGNPAPDGVLDDIVVFVDKSRSTTSRAQISSKNEGEQDESERPNIGGSKFKWAAAGKVYNGLSRGANQYYPNMDGNGRADLYWVDPVINTADIYYNQCSGGSSGGDDQNMNPNLPPYSQPADPVPPRDDFSFGVDLPDANKWIALGDSYSAGIGAGSELRNPRDPDNKCHTTDSSYPKQMEAHNDVLRQRLDFISCSGDTTRDMLYGGGYRGGRSQLLRMQDNAPNQYKLLTLTVGGNDVGFFSVVKNCILAPLIARRCDEALNFAEEKVGLHGSTANSYVNFKADLRKLYADILFSADRGTTIVVLGYAQFFNAVTDKCNEKNMALINLPSQGRLTKDFRDRVNKGVLALNTVIKEQVNAVQNDLGYASSSEKRVRYLSIDHLFDGHRFCETEAGVDYDSSWFFLPLRSDKDSSGNEVVRRDGEYSEKVDLSRRDDAFCDDPTTGWDCMVGRLVDEGGEVNDELYPSDALNSPQLVPRAAVSKAFHPKAIGHDAISRLLPEAWSYWGLNPADRSYP